MNSLNLVRRVLRGLYGCIVVLCFAVGLHLLAAEVVLSIGEQMPPGLLFVGEKALWKGDICVEPPKFTKNEIEYVFSSLEFTEKSLSPKIEGESLTVTLPKAAVDGKKIVYKGMTISTSEFKQPGTKTITLKVKAVYKAKGQPDEVVQGKEMKLQAQVGKLEIVDANNKDAIIKDKQVTIVGKIINLKGIITPTPGKDDKVSDHQWTIPGSTVKAYTQSASKGEKIDLKNEDKTKDSTGYYWIDGGVGLKVEYKVKVNGREVKASAEYDVLRPDSKFLSITTGDFPKTKGVGIGDNGLFKKDQISLHYGIKTDPGIVWIGEATTPNISGGTLAFTNLVNTELRVTFEDNLKVIKTSEGKFVLDNEPQYNDKTVKLMAKEKKGITTNDSPGIGLNDDFKLASRSDEFVTYLMFKPGGDNSIWVTLRTTKWFWKGSAKKIAKGKFDFSDNPSPDASKDPKSENSIQLPEWQKNITDVKTVEDKK